MTGAFIQHARILIRNGYSPLPIKPGEKRPVFERWDAYRERQMADEEIREIAATLSAAGLGVAGGFGGLVPVDIDTDDEEIRAAIRKALPKATIGKRGKRGATVFFRGSVAACKLKTPERKSLVEVLSTGQTVIPPTIHPETGKAYTWTTKATLLNTPIGDLPEITEAHIKALEKALEPWRPPPKAWTPKATNGARKPAPKRLKAYAQAALDAEATALARMGKNSGRNTALFEAACKLGSFVHHGVLTMAEAENALLGACNANELIKDDGQRACVATLASGIRKAEGDELRLPPDDGPPPRTKAPKAASLKLAPDPTVTAEAGPKPLNPIRLVPFADIRIDTQRRYLIKGVIPRVGITLIWGAPKCGKSFLVLDMTMHVALGWEYRGRRVNQGVVIYCCFEGQTGFEARVEAWRQKHLGENDASVPFYLQPVRFGLVSRHGELIEVIRGELGNANPAAVVLDTLNRSMEGSESSDEDMTAYVAAADAIREEFGCAVIIVHHCGHDDRRPRGHTALMGAIDASAAVAKDQAGHIVATVELMKDGATGDKFASRLVPLTLGEDEDGDAITSCIVVPSDIPNGAACKPLKGQPSAALRLLKMAIDEAPATPPASNYVPRLVRTTTLTDFRRYFDLGTVTESDKPDTKLKAFVRACGKLQDAGIIGVWQDFVWLTDKPDKAGQR